MPLRTRAAAPLAALAGAMLAVAGPPANLWPLAWVAMPVLLVALRGRRIRGGLLMGLVAGTTACLIGMSWVAGLLTRFAMLPWPAAALAWILAALAHGAGLAVASAATCWLWRQGVRPVLALPMAVVAAELVVPMVFPWQISMTQGGVLGLIQVADLLGARGVSMVVALGGAGAYELLAAPWDRRARRDAGVALAVVLLCLGYGAVRLIQVGRARDAAPALTVGLVQPSLTIEEKHERERFPVNLALHRDMSAEAERDGAELVVWPESAYPYYVPRGWTTDMPGERAIHRGFTAPVLFGALSREGDRQRWNSAFLLDAEGRLLGPADKNRLLLFGEYVPFYDSLPALRRALPRVWAFTPGEEPGVIESPPVRAGVLNCYEDVLPDFVRSLARRRPNLLVNVTNDAWFGDTAEPHQHAALARFRAVEHRVDLVRAVNSGVSTIVEATGVEAARTRPFVRTTVVGRVHLLDAGTPYTALGDAWAWLVTLAVPVVGLVARRRRRSERIDQ